MIDILITLFYFIVALTVLVGIHEFGHFWVSEMSLFGKVLENF